MCIRDSPTPPRSASGAPAGPFRRQKRNLREKRRRSHPSGALGANFEALSGPRAVPGSNARSEFSVCN
eukprot:14200774-Alexandrium_andersonii.AAC.1